MNWILNGWENKLFYIINTENPFVYKFTDLHIKVVSSLATDFSYNLLVLIRW